MSTEENKALVRRATEEIWNQKKLALVDEIAAEDSVTHLSTMTIQGPEQYKQLAAMYFSAFPDLHLTIEDLIAEGDRVVTRWTARGTHQGEFMGIPPTGKQATTTGMTVSRIVGGKFVESWQEGDNLGLLQQLGAIPSMG